MKEQLSVLQKGLKQGVWRSFVPSRKYPNEQQVPISLCVVNGC